MTVLIVDAVTVSHEKRGATYESIQTDYGQIIVMVRTFNGNADYDGTVPGWSRRGIAWRPTAEPMQKSLVRQREAATEKALELASEWAKLFATNDTELFTHDVIVGKYDPEDPLCYLNEDEETEDPDDDPES